MWLQHKQHQVMTCVLIGILVQMPTTVQPNVIPLEAAFQGRCENGNPCAQVCFNIHNDMFECDCRQGYDLSDNGYTCIESTQKNSTVAASLSTAGNVSLDDLASADASSKTSSVSIQIEVDIEPPPLKPNDGLSEEKLQKLGLPTHHVHFTAASKGGHPVRSVDPQRLTSEELLAPEDIKITYSESDSSNSMDPFITTTTTENDKSAETMTPWSFLGDKELNAYENFEAWSKIYGDEKSSNTDKDNDDDDDDNENNVDAEAPRVLPSAEEDTKEHVSDKQASESEANKSSYTDKVFELDAFCNLDCGKEGSCFMERQPESGLIKKRCLCPLGRTGKSCSTEHLATLIHFSGQSFLSLPTLTNAYSDLQLSIEFKPETGNGILVLTGETEDMTGDYLTLLLRDGHVELRLDCGTGPGIVKSASRVNIGRWNRLTVFRHDWGVWIQLNGGPHEEGRSQGLFSRITFAQPVMLGGTGILRNTDHFLEMDAGYVGCIRNLEINQKSYNFQEKSVGGDAIGGRDIDQCNNAEKDCQAVSCQHQGTCSIINLEGSTNTQAVCHCPLGFEGKFCERPIEIEVPSFEANDNEVMSSHLVYGGLGETSPLWNEFEVVLRPTNEDGLILYNGNANEYDLEGDNEDFVAIFLRNGFVEFAFNAGDGVTIVRSHSPLSLGSWHTVRVSRTGLMSEISVDEQKRMFQIGLGSFTQVSLRQHLYLGGVPSFELVSPAISIRRSFSGCIQKVSINNAILPLIQSAIGGINVGRCLSHPCTTSIGVEPVCGQSGICQPLMDNYTCECPLGRIGGHCEMSLSLDEADSNAKPTNEMFPYFNGDSFLHYHDAEMTKNVIGNTNSFNLRVRLQSSDGLILWTGGDHFSPSSDYLLLGLRNGHLEFRFNLGNGEAVLIYNDTRIDDGKWHRMRATRTEQTASLKIDNGHILTGSSPGKLRQLNGNGQIFIGGVDDLDHLPVPEFRKGIIGCVAQLSVGQVFDVNLLRRAKNGRNVDTCRDLVDGGEQSLLLNIP